MQTVNAIMLILGCAHDAQLCEPTQLDQPYYTSVEQCEGDIPAQQHFAEGFLSCLLYTSPSPRDRG